MIASTLTDTIAHIHPKVPKPELVPSLAFENIVTLTTMSRLEASCPDEDRRQRVGLGGPLALLRTPEGVRYIASDKELQQMLEQRPVGYELHNIQYARQAITNYKTDRKIDAIADNMKDLGGAAVAVGAIGIALAMAAATLINYFGNKFATDPFNDTVAAQSAGTVFQINKDKGTASIGKPEAGGVTWYFSDKPEACTSRLNTKKETEGKFVAMSLMERSFTRDCNFVDKWPTDSAQQQLYAPAYTTYLQTVQPAAGHTAVSVQKIIDARRAYDAVKP